MFPFSRFSRYFIEVARHGSLRKAADSLGISASAINRQILSVEESLEVPLFDRLPSGLRLTAAGELLFDDIMRWQKEFMRSCERIDDLKGVSRGRVDIAMIDAASEGPLAHALAALGQELPEMVFELHVEDNHRIVEKIESGEVDFGILLDPKESSSLAVHTLIEVPLGIAMAVDHPMAGRKSISLSAVLDERQMLPAAPLIVSDAAATLYSRHGIDPHQLSSCDNIRLMRTLIREGAAVGVLSLLDVMPDLASKQIAFVPFKGSQRRSLSLALCIPPRRQLSRAALEAIERVAQTMASMVAGER